MNIDKNNELCNKYKHLLSERFFGFEVPDGWDWVVEKYLEKTQWDAKKNGLKIQIEQVKEIFAGMKIYTYVVDDITGLDAANIAYCEALADYTCEKCGRMSKEKQYTSGWITGLCPECFKEKQNETK